ncbi:MAG: DUF4157 domain-containing protein [Myxococcales bacterium]|nr:DUF4157 domain-containing protein [Myxococcales bacterium]
MSDRTFRSSHESEGVTPLLGYRPSPGKSSLTSRLTGRGPLARAADLGASRAGGRDANGVARDAEPAVAAATSSAGTALPAGARDRFESSLGVDLGAVRVHTGPDSAHASAAVGARAYTIGNDIHFADGQYRPDDPFGMHLLAHEVAHTVQQSSGTPRRQHKLEVTAPGDVAEVEADRAADAMVIGAPASIGSMQGVGRVIARAADPAAPATGAAPAADGAAPAADGKGEAMGSKEKPFPVGLDGVSLSLGKGSALKIPWAMNEMSISKSWKAEEKLEKTLSKQIAVPAGALPGGLSMTASGTASLGASVSANVTGSVVQLGGPHTDSAGAEVSVSGSAGLEATVEGMLGLGAYVGIPPINVGAEGYVTLGATTSAKATVAGQGRFLPSGGWSGSVTFTVPLEAKITGTGGIRLFYSSLIKSGELQKFELKSVDIAKASIACVIQCDLATGQATDHTVTTFEVLPLFQSVPVTAAEYRQWAKREEGERDGGSGSGPGVPPSAFDEPEEDKSFDELCGEDDPSVMCDPGGDPDSIMYGSGPGVP